MGDHRAEARRIVWSGPLAQQVLAKDWLLRRRQVRADPEHVCDTPFWRTEDSRWECPDCGRGYVWTTSARTVPGVPASVCTVYENRWEAET